MAGSSSLEIAANSGPEAVPAASVREQLARIVNSAVFASSARLTRFLTHIVNRTIAGESGSLKEFSVAMEVFDRSSAYDPNIDAIVRVQARRLRSKLKTYYEDGPGQSDPVLIGLRPVVTSRSFAGLQEGPHTSSPNATSPSLPAVHPWQCSHLPT